MSDVAAIPIVALDVPTASDALRVARALGPRCRFFKVGSELFTAAGPSVLHALREELGAEPTSSSISSSTTSRPPWLAPFAAPRGSGRAW